MLQRVPGWHGLLRCPVLGVLCKARPSAGPPLARRSATHAPVRAQTKTTQTVFGITDQLALNILLEDGVHTMTSPPDDPRVLLLRNGTLRLHPLPVLRFPSGHVAFVQRTPWR